MAADLWDRVRYPLRSLMRTPGVTMLATITLALGIGVNTTVFSIAHGVLFRSLPFPRAEELVLLWETYSRMKTGGDKLPAAAPSFLDWKNQSSSFEAMSAFTSFSFSLTAQGEPPAKLDGLQATSEFFSVLGVKPQKGRTFREDEDQPGKNHVAVISDSLWRRQFAGDPNVVGKTITLTGEKYEVIGVMPRGFDFPEGGTMPPTLDFGAHTEIWVPLTFAPNVRRDRSTLFLAVVARLKSGVSVARAQSEMGVIASRLDQAYRKGRGYSARVMELQDQVVGGVRMAVLVLLGAVALVLLIACSNVANLWLARLSSRQKDIAVRIALGSSRTDIVWHMLAESILLGIAGSALGLGLAELGIKILAALSPDFPRVGEININVWVLAFALLLAIAAGVISGLIPALDACRRDPNTVLKDESRSSSASARSRNVLNLIIISEFSVTLVLLIGAGLLIRSFLLLQQVEIGFNPHNVLTMRFVLPDYKYGKPEQRIAFVRQVLQRVSTAPGVDSAAITVNLPFTGTGTSVPFSVVSRAADALQESPRADIALATPDYLKVMRIPLLSGRFFSEQDTIRSRPVVVINEAAAKAYWPNENPVGQLLNQSLDPKGTNREIIGVMGSVRETSFSEVPKPELIMPYSQIPFNLLFLIARTKAEPLSMTSKILGQLHSVDPDQPVYDLASMEQVIRHSNAQRSFNMFLFTVFAGLALVLAMVGVYGVMVFSVSRRLHEMGIRMALGARPNDIRKLVLTQGLKLTGIGLLIGLIMASGVTHIMASLLYGTNAIDAQVFGSASILLTLLAIIASYVPAHRAANVEPSVLFHQR